MSQDRHRIEPDIYPLESISPCEYKVFCEKI